MNLLNALDGLSAFVKLLDSNKIKDSRGYYTWAKLNEARIAGYFGYERLEGMPSIVYLVKPFFHPTLPLVGLNYTPQAHNTLYEFPTGWTDALRLCRGIIFERTGKIVALAFPKFFNYGEHEENRHLPNLSFEASVKHDGHLGIVFKYQGQLLVTTRGDFESPTSKLAKTILKKYFKNQSQVARFPDALTLLVEIIHPETRVYLDYHGESCFIIIGAFDRQTLEDYSHPQLQQLSEWFGVPVAQLWQGKSLKALIELMQDRTIENQEGFVVKFSNGLRVKLKFQTYIGKMVADKLSYTYLMNRMIKGNLERMLETLPEEIYGTALNMLGEIMLLFYPSGTPTQRWRRLYGLLSGDESTSYFQSVCRQFVKHMLI